MNQIKKAMVLTGDEILSPMALISNDGVSLYILLGLTSGGSRAGQGCKRTPLLPGIM